MTKKQLIARRAMTKVCRLQPGESGMSDSLVLSRSCILQRGNLVGADGKSYRCSRSACVVLVLKESIKGWRRTPELSSACRYAEPTHMRLTLIMHRLCFANSGHNKSDNGLSSVARTNSSVSPHTLNPFLGGVSSRAQTKAPCALSRGF